MVFSPVSSQYSNIVYEVEFLSSDLFLLLLASVFVGYFQSSFVPRPVTNNRKI